MSIIFRIILILFFSYSESCSSEEENTFLNNLRDIRINWKIKDAAVALGELRVQMRKREISKNKGAIIEDKNSQKDENASRKNIIEAYSANRLENFPKSFEDYSTNLKKERPCYYADFPSAAEISKDLYKRARANSNGVKNSAFENQQFGMGFELRDVSCKFKGPEISKSRGNLQASSSYDEKRSVTKNSKSKNLERGNYKALAADEKYNEDYLLNKDKKNDGKNSSEDINIRGKNINSCSSSGTKNPLESFPDHADSVKSNEYPSAEKLMKAFSKFIIDRSSGDGKNLYGKQEAQPNIESNDDEAYNTDQSLLQKNPNEIYPISSVLINLAKNYKIDIGKWTEEFLKTRKEYLRDIAAVEQSLKIYQFTIGQEYPSRRNVHRDLCGILYKDHLLVKDPFRNEGCVVGFGESESESPGLKRTKFSFRLYGQIVVLYASKLWENYEGIPKDACGSYFIYAKKDGKFVPVDFFNTKYPTDLTYCSLNFKLPPVKSMKRSGQALENVDQMEVDSRLYLQRAPPKFVVIGNTKRRYTKFTT